MRKVILRDNIFSWIMRLNDIGKVLEEWNSIGYIDDTDRIYAFVSACRESTPVTILTVEYGSH